MDTISILITTYKRPALVVEAINSCLTQTYAPFEIIIGDDSPDDLTKIVVEELQSESPIPIKYIHNKPSLKQARNVNMLFKEASGDKLLLLHDDDLLMPESLETLSAVFNENPSVDVAYGKQYIISYEGEIDPVSSITFNQDFYRETQYAGSVLSSFEAGLSQQFPNNGYLIKSEIAKRLQWRTDVGDGCEFDFGYRVGLAGYTTYFVDKFVGKYRLSTNSMSHSKTCDMAYQAFIIMKNSPVTTPRAKEIRARRLYERAPIAITEAVNTGRRKEALAILFSEWYRRRILTPRGIKRVLYISFYVPSQRMYSLKAVGSLLRRVIKKYKPAPNETLTVG